MAISTKGSASLSASPGMLVAISAPSAGGYEGEHRPRQLPPHVHMALGRIVQRRRARAEQALQLVGAERLDRRETGQQQRRYGDQPAAAGDRIDEARDEGGERKQEDEMGGDVGQGLVAARSRAGRRKGSALPPQAGHLRKPHFALAYRP